VIEDIGEGFLHAIGRFLGYIFIDLMVNIVFYYTGWFFLKVVTFGFYPPKKNPMSWGEPNHSHGFVSFVGFLVWVGAAIVIIQRLS